MKEVRAKKQLGQHFLTDLNIAQKIVDALEAHKTNNTLEIGPGMGVLTQFLLNRSDLNIKLVEIDTESVSYLNEKYSALKDRVFSLDFLKAPLKDIFDTDFNIIGNFPYNISSQIFFRILEYRSQIPEVVCMIQKEVAERIAEKPGTKTYGILSVLLQSFYDIEYLFTVHENVFNPPPAVKSAVIKLKRNTRDNLDCNEKLFFQIVKATFNHRRKTIRNTIKPFFGGNIPDHHLMTERPEKLDVDQFIELTKLVESNR